MLYDDREIKFDLLEEFPCSYQKKFPITGLKYILIEAKKLGITKGLSIKYILDVNRYENCGFSGIIVDATVHISRFDY